MLIVAISLREMSRRQINHPVAKERVENNVLVSVARPRSFTR